MTKHQQKLQRQRAATNRKKLIRNAAIAGVILLVAGVAIAAVLPFGRGDESRRPSVRQDPVVTDAAQVTVDVLDNDFEPKTLTIKKGATVTWNFEGKAKHDVTDEDGRFASGTLGRGGEFAMTFDQPGRYFYYCTLHHAMQGTLTVTE